MKLIDSCLKNLENEYTHITQQARCYEPVVEEIESWFYSEFNSEKAALALSVTPGLVQGILVRMNLSKEETFKVLTEPIQHLLELGWSAEGSKTIFEGLGVEYVFEKEKDPNFTERSNLHLTIRCWPHSLSTKCVRVEVGTTPKFELRCTEA